MISLSVPFQNLQAESKGRILDKSQEAARLEDPKIAGLPLGLASLKGREVFQSAGHSRTFTPKLLSQLAISHDTFTLLGPKARRHHELIKQARQAFCLVEIFGKFCWEGL